jgi:transposase
MVDDLQDYGVYAAAVHYDFDVDEMSDSDDNADEHQNHDDHQNSNRANRVKNTTNSQRQGIYGALLERNNRWRLKRKSTSVVAEQFHVSRRTVQRIWDKAKKCHAQSRPVDVSSKKPKNCGPKRFPVDLSRVATIALHKRSTIRKLAKALCVSKSSVHRWFKEGHLRRHSNSLKPFMKDANKKKRLRWCLSMLDPTTLPNEPNFIEMGNIIHIDEKWFNATKKNKNFYMLPGEVDPHRTMHKKKIN